MGKEWNLHVIPNTHWDREWYYSFEKFNRRFVKLMDRLINLLERDAEFRRFTLDGQFLAIKDYLTIRPEMNERVMKLVSEGRLLIGPWYTQPIESLSSGESLVRNLMLGIRESIKLGGVMKISYVIDGFGHISKLPMILRGFGIEDVVAWRGIPAGSKSVFRWKSDDGSCVFMFYSNDGYGEATALPSEEEDFEEIIDNTGFKRLGLKNSIDFLVEHRKHKATTNHLMLLNGIDHSFAQENLAEVIDKVNRLFPQMHACISGLDEYIRDVKDVHEKEGISYEEYCGEMFDSFESPVLKDVHSTRADVKYWNSRVEMMLEKWTEPFSVIAWLLGSEYPDAEIWKAWELVLQNHAHDSIACSSIDAVYRQVISRFEQANDIGEDIAGESLQYLCKLIARSYGEQIGCSINKEHDELILVVFNPLSWMREDVVEAVIDIPKDWGYELVRILDGETEIPVVINEIKDTVRLKFNPYRGHPSMLPVKRFDVSFKTGNVPGNGYKVFKVARSSEPLWSADSLIKTSNMMENEFLKVKINNNGTIDLYDMQSLKEYKGIHFFQDSGEAGNGYTHIAPLNDTVLFSNGNSTDISLIEKSPVQSAFKVVMEMELPEALDSDPNTRSKQTVKCRITCIIALKAGSRRVDISTVIDNTAKDHRLRVMVPTGIKACFSFAGQPFDVVKRKIETLDLNRYKVEKPGSIFPFQYFVDVNDGNYGLMMACEDNYEYEVTDDCDRTIAITLIRSTGKINENSNHSIKGFDIPQAQCIGSHTFHYSIIPHIGGWEQAVRMAYEAKYKMQVVMEMMLEEDLFPFGGKHTMARCLAKSMSFINLSSDKLIINAIKKHKERNSLVIRLLNLMERSEEGILTISIPMCSIKEVKLIDLNEDRLAEIPVQPDGTIRVSLNGKSVKTYEIILGKTDL